MLYILQLLLICENYYIIKPEDHWSCITHLSAEDILKSVVNEKKMFENIDCLC